MILLLFLLTLAIGLLAQWHVKRIYLVWHLLPLLTRKQRD